MKQYERSQIKAEVNSYMGSFQDVIGALTYDYFDELYSDICEPIVRHSKSRSQFISEATIKLMEMYPDVDSLYSGFIEFLNKDCHLSVLKSRGGSLDEKLKAFEGFFGVNEESMTQDFTNEQLTYFFELLADEIIMNLLSLKNVRSLVEFTHFDVLEHFNDIYLSENEFEEVVA